MNEICILAEFKVFEENVEKAKALFGELQTKSMEEEGCITYEVKQVSRDEQWFIIFEKFANKEAHDFHKTTPAYLEVLKGKLEPLFIDKMVRFLI